MSRFTTLSLGALLATTITQSGFAADAPPTVPAPEPVTAAPAPAVPAPAVPAPAVPAPAVPAPAVPAPAAPAPAVAPVAEPTAAAVAPAATPAATPAPTTATPPATASAPAINLSGHWKSEGYDRMTLEQKGDLITGTYVTQNDDVTYKGVIDATLKGKVITGIWAERPMLGKGQELNGKLEWKVVDDKALMGWYDEEGEKTDWNLTR